MLLEGAHRDLAVAEVDLGAETVSVTTLGWLDPTRAFRVGTFGNGFRERLATLLALTCTNRVDPLGCAMLDRACRFCGHLPRARCNLWVPDLERRRLFYAPGAIHHYVDAHGYQPPRVFVEAVMHCPEPGSTLYWRIFARCASGRLRDLASNRARNMLNRARPTSASTSGLVGGWALP